MLEFIVIASAVLFLRFIESKYAGIRLRNRILFLTRNKISFQDDLTFGNAQYYRELFRETELVVNQMCRAFTSVNVLYQLKLPEGNYAAMFFDWKQHYLILDIEILEKYRGSNLFKSLLAHEIAHYENRLLHLTQEKIISYCSSLAHLIILWSIYQNINDIFTVGGLILLAVLLRFVWKAIFLALRRRSEYKCDEDSFRFFPTGCLSFMESELAGDGGDLIQSTLLGRIKFLLTATHPPNAERLRRLRAKAGRERPQLESADPQINL